MSATWTDRARQLAMLGGATSFVALGATGDYHEHEPLQSPVVPVPEAFSIWGPIYLGNLALVVSRATAGADPVMREVGWPLAAAWGGAGLWSRAFELKNLPMSLGLIAGTTAAAGLAYHRLPVQPADWQQQWLVQVPVGLLFGWLTVAAGAGATEEMLSLGVDVDPEVLAIGTIGVVAGVAGAVTVGMDRTLAYPAAVAWGLGGIVLAQKDKHPAVASAAALALAGLGIAAFVARVRRRAEVRAQRRAPVGRSSWIPAEELYAGV